MPACASAASTASASASTAGTASVEPYDELVIATGSLPFVPPVEGLHDATGRLTAGVFVFRTLDDCEAHHRCARRARSRAAVIGGGLLGLEAARGCSTRARGARRAPRCRTSWSASSTPPAGASSQRTLEGWACTCTSRRRTTAILGERARSRGLALQGRQQLDCDMVVISAGIRPNVALGTRGRPRGRARHRRRTTTCARPTTRASSPSASAPSTAAGSTASWRRCGSRPRCSPTTHRHATPTPPTTARRLATKLKVMGVDLAVDGREGAGRRRPTRS